MTIELINVGSLPNDGTGDPLRVAFEKINNNFLYVNNSGSAATPDGSIQFRYVNKLNSIAYHNQVYLAVGYPSRFYVSTDAEIWTAVTSPTENTINQVITTTTGFIAVGTNGTIISSIDGETWTTLNSGTSEDLYGIDYNTNAGIFTVVGTNGTILTSTTGATWTLRAAGLVTVDLKGVTSQTGQWVAVGATGKVLVSTNATAWTSTTIGSEDLNAVQISDSYYNIVGSSGAIYASTNLTIWNERTSGTTENLNSIAYATSGESDGLTVAVGELGTILTSDDLGLTWTTIDPSVTASLNDVTFANDLLWTAGSDGTILSSVDTLSWTNVSIPGEFQGSSKLLFDDVTGIISLDANIIPQGNVVNSIGNSNVRFNVGYFGANGTHVGNVALRSSNTTLRVTDTGNPNTFANVQAAYYFGDGGFLSNIAPTQGAAGSNTQIQYNNNGDLGASASFTYNSATDTLTVGNIAGVGTTKVPFTFETTTENIVVVPAGRIISNIQIFVTTEFDDTDSTLTVGTNSSPSQLFTENDASIYQEGSYAVIPNTKYSVNTQVVLFIDPANSTVGEGLLVLTYE